MNPASLQELAYIPRTSRGEQGSGALAGSSATGEERWRTDASLWAYCRELCGPEACDQAVAAILTELEDATAIIREEELLLITRTIAARFAVGHTNGSSGTRAAPTDRTCGETSARLAAWANHLLTPGDRRELAEHLEGCLNCQAIKIRMERAERGFATLAAGVVPFEAELDAAVERPVAPQARLPSGRAKSAVRAYCRELCGPPGFRRAVSESLTVAGIGARSIMVGEQELLQATRLAAAKQALIDAAPRDAACAATPSRLALLANDRLDAGDQLELERHLEQCLACRASQIKLARAERAFAIMVSTAAGTEP
ncbi:MAG: zf-HC2 domain-containing protein, partial [Actinomycetota bacterium]|nr:zf-HC2 domain-containing protein [Actinomycetota bacterium]